MWLYDDNGITIDGSTDLAFSENIALRFESMGWRVLKIDGHEHEEIRSALKEATNEAHYPTLIICKTHIGYGSPNKVDSAASHGAPLGTDEIKATRAQLGWQCEPFEVPEAVKAHYNNSQERSEPRLKHGVATLNNGPQPSLTLALSLMRCIFRIRRIPDRSITRCCSGKRCDEKAFSGSHF